jgi:hypothetical protein
MSNPYSNPVRHAGYYDNSHTSNATLVYSPQSLPTPWPILTVGYFVTFFSAFWGAFSSFQQYKIYQGLNGSRSHGYHPSKVVTSSLNVLAYIITNLRSLAAFAQAVQAAENGNHRFEDIMAISALIISNSQYLFLDVIPNSQRASMMRHFNYLLRLLSLLVTVLAFIACFILLGVVVDDDGFFYGRWNLEGGNCPVTVSECSPQPYVGCRDPNFSGGVRINQKNLNTVNSANYIRLEQLIAGIFIITAFVFFLPAISLQCKAIRDAHLEVEETTAVRRWLHFGACIVVVLISIVSVPISASQQKHPKSIIVIDSLGSVVPAANANASTWSDCFEIKAPSDKNGFLNVWWQERTSNVAEVISLT